MKTRILIIVTIITCAILWGSQVFATKLTPLTPNTPAADLATPFQELTKPDLTRPTADLTKPAVDVMKPGQDRINPEFLKPVRELMPMPVSNRTDDPTPVRLKQK